MASMDKILSFAKKNGYADAEYQGLWNGFDVYQPFTFTDHSPAKVGPPLKILVKGHRIRMTSVEEAFAYLKTLPPDYEED